MPLVAHTDLPTFERLMDEGRPVLPKGRALSQDIRELHIGLINIMPDAALEATERQFFRLIGQSNRVAQIYMHVTTLPLFERSAEAQAHIDQYYTPFEQLRAEGLDALIITGTNEEVNPHVSEEGFWAPLRDAINWAHENVTSTIFSCLAAHAFLTYHHDELPGWRDKKRWGVFPHKVLNRKHPLVRGMNTVFDVPHSRFSEITPEQFTEAGMEILVESPEAGVHVATSKDGFRMICFQGHPEYDTFSLFKEYKREVQNFIEGRREDYPPFPNHYFNEDARAVLESFRARALDGKAGIDDFPEDIVSDVLENSWADSARSFVASWVGKVYEITHVDRRKPFMDGIDPEDPLGILKSGG